MKRLLLLSAIFTFGIIIQSNGQSAHSWLRKADKAYSEDNYSAAEEGYRKSLEKKNGLNAKYNLGNSTYMQSRFEEAVEHYTDALALAEGDQEKSRALFNLGNSMLKNGNLDESIESYKSALKYNPEDDEVRKNLFIAKLMKKQQQEQQQEQNENQENEQNEQDQNQQQQQQQQNQDSQQQNQDQQVDNENKQEQQAEAQDLSKEDALKLLEVIENEEKNVQEKLRKVSGKKKNVKKDW